MVVIRILGLDVRISRLAQPEIYPLHSPGNVCLDGSAEASSQAIGMDERLTAGSESDAQLASESGTVSGRSEKKRHDDAAQKTQYQRGFNMRCTCCLCEKGDLGGFKQCAVCRERKVRYKKKSRSAVRDPVENMVIEEEGFESLEACVGEKLREVSQDFTADDGFAPLLKAAKRSGATLESVCNALKLSPAAVQEAVRAAKRAGYAIELNGSSIGVQVAASSDVPKEITPCVAGPVILGVISDTHFGSKYCLREELADFVKIAYGAGVRVIVHSGDMLDGCYEHGKWELSHHGAHEQCDDAIEHLPAYPGLTYEFCTGNHDQTFVNACGLNIGSFIEDRFKSASRHDVHFHGNMEAWLTYKGAKIHLKHPKGGCPYSLSYRAQKIVEAYAPGQKPDILSVGHLHKSCGFTTRGVHAIQAPCFQGPGSAFSNSLVGQPANGGLILRWETTEHGTIRKLTREEVAYYRNEQYRTIE